MDICCIFVEYLFKMKSIVDQERVIGQRAAAEPRPSRVYFANRVSALTELQGHEELKAAYGVLVSLYSFFFLATLACYALDEKWLEVDARFLQRQLSTSHYVLAAWLALHAVGLLVIYPTTRLLYDRCTHRTPCLLAVGAALAVCLALPPVVIVAFDVQFLLTFILVIEQIRLLMKYLSFVVENGKENSVGCLQEYLNSCQRHCVTGCVGSECFAGGLDATCKLALTSSITKSEGKCYDSREKNNNERATTASATTTTYTARGGEVKGPSPLPEVTSKPTMGKFCYFLFAPTLIYRPWYPRLPGRVNWSLVVMYFAEFFAFWFLGLQLLTKFLMPTFALTGLEPFQGSKFVMAGLKTGFCASVCFFGLGYGFLHCWLNGWAEVLRFADRQFYREWWLSRSVSQFWRRWNLLVHLWLSEYVYAPLMSCTGGSQVLSTGTVYLVSALAHEYATGFALRLLLPIFASVMFFSFPLTYIIHFSGKQNKVLVVALLHSLLWLATSAVLLAYSLEIFARANCLSRVSSPLLDIFVPRFPSCISILY